MYAIMRKICLRNYHHNGLIQVDEGSQNHYGDLASVIYEDSLCHESLINPYL